MENKKSIGLPGGPNEMFTYVTSVFDIYQAPSNIEGQGMFAGKPFKKGDLIGLAHSNDQPASQLGRMHNHDENSSTMISKKSGNNRFVFAAKDLQPGDELTTNYRMQPELEQPEQFQNGGSVMVPPRQGVRKNPDGTESTHLMATETLDGKNWFSFPTLFQDPDGTWIDMSTKPWKEAYKEAERRGELIDFGADKESAIKFGEGSWKPKAQYGGEQATLSAYEEPAWYEKAFDRLASPMTALGYLARGQDIPDNLPINMQERNAYDMVIDMVNPFAMGKYAVQAKKDYDNEEYLSAGFNALGALPVVPAILSKGKKVLPKAVVNNITRYADDVVKNAKPNAKNFGAVTEVNPLTQTQAKNLANQGRNTEIFNAFEEGANTIDDFVKSYTGDLSSPEGFKRLIAQEADYLRSIGFDEARIAAQSEINAGARLNEIINIGNTNRAISKGEKAVDAVIGNNYNFNNASYTPNTHNAEYLDDLFYQPGMDIGPFNLNKTKVGAKVLPGNTNLGTMFSNNRAVAAHEIGGHGLQSGRRLPLDQRLKKLNVDTSNLNTANQDAYGYFMSGSKGKEPSAYLHELRQAMLDNKLIRNRYDYVSPEMLKRAQTIFDLRPSGTVNTIGDAFHSNTRILDFMKPVESNFNLLSRELNKLPAIVPIGVAGATGATYSLSDPNFKSPLNQKQYGGEETNPSFDSWYSRYAKATGNSTNPYDKEHYYDYESFFNDNISKPENLYPLDTRDWHLSSKYKKEGHPRLYEYPDGTYGENYIEGAKDTREFQKGGNVRYTSNPNDRGIKAYADSLDLYNGYMDMYNQALNTNAGTREQVARRYNIEQDPTASHLFHLAGTNLGSGKQYMWAHNTNDVNPNILPIAARSYADESNARTSPFTAEYKKPVQPVKYRDPEVVAKQQQLIDSGYDIGAADGIWGPKSQAAWEQTQKEIVNLKPNVVEPTTKKEYSRFVNIHGKNYGFNNQEEFFNIAKSKNMPKGWAEANVPKNLEFQKGGEDITKKGFDWGGYFSGEQGWIPDYDGVPTLQMFDEQPVKQEVKQEVVEKVKEEQSFPQEQKPSYNPNILKGLSEEQTARRQALLNAANVVANTQDNDENLKRLLVMSAVMENTLGADANAYSRDYTRGPMSIDDITYQDLFAIREGAGGYTTQQKKNADWLNQLGLDARNMEQTLRSDDPLAGMAAARLVYGRAPESLPSAEDPNALYNYYLKYYNKGGIDKYGGADAHKKKFVDFYNQTYRQEGGETDMLSMYSNYINGDYDNTKLENKAIKIYDKLNRIHYKDAKALGMTPANYILTYVIGKA